MLDHLYSCLFGTFLGNCEQARMVEVRVCAGVRVCEGVCVLDHLRSSLFGTFLGNCEQARMVVVHVCERGVRAGVCWCVCV